MAEAQREKDPHVWMIRTSENALSGPYTRGQLVQLIEEEKLELTDEICHGGGYWIFLHEQNEVKKYLGIEVPAALVDAEEPTQTEHTQQIDSNLGQAAHPIHPAHSVQTDVAAMGARAARNHTISAPHEKNDGVPELPVSAESTDPIDDHAAVVSNRAFRQFKPREQVSETSTPEAAAAALATVEVSGVSTNPKEAGEPSAGSKALWIALISIIAIGAAVAGYFFTHKN